MPIYAYADLTGRFRRWYPNLKQLGFGRTSGKGYWGEPGSDVKGNRGGGSYSRYGALGQGLSDQPQHAYNAIKRSKLTSGVDRAIFDREVMTFRFNGQDVFKGLYNIPGAPKYAGGTVNYAMLSSPQQQTVRTALRKERGIGTSQFGAITTGRSRGYPSWMIGMINKARAVEEDTGSSKLPVGLALVALKVLL